MSVGVASQGTSLFFPSSCAHVALHADGLWSQVFRQLAALQRSDVSVSANRTYDDYRLGFHASKFCLVLPGHTSSTSQSTRAILSGCVPVFVQNDESQLPFDALLDYHRFSVRLRIHQAVGPNGGLAIDRLLRSHVASGRYEQLLAGVRAVRCFFDYRETGPCSPFGATLVELALANEASERGTPQILDESLRDGLAASKEWARVRHAADGEVSTEMLLAHFQSHSRDLPPARCRHGRKLVEGKAHRRARADAALNADEGHVPCHSWLDT